MDEDQASCWAAAQREVGVGADLVPAALRQLDFLAAVDRRRWLYEGPLLERAIRRYKTCWLPLLDKHTQAGVVDGPLVVPLDCEWIWHCHRLNPVQYIRDCKKLYGRILNNDLVESSTKTKSKHQSEKVWSEFYPEEPFELEHTSCSDTASDVNPGASESISYDLVSAVKRQSTFYYQVGTPSMHDQRFLEEAFARYKGFLYLIKMNKEKGVKRFHVPTYDVDLMWHTHQLHPVTYCNDMLKLLGKVLEHDDTDADRSEGKKLDVGFTETTEQFESTFGVRYWKVAAMYRGNSPSPVTSTPQIFSSESGNGFSSCKAEKHIDIRELTVVEIYLLIVDIKNLPSAIPKESVYVWFNKNQPDQFISDGGRLDVSTITGKNLGAGFQCEPTGELVLTVMVDQASKKLEAIGKVYIPLQELTGPKLSFERWFELKTHGGHSASPPISLCVAASSTVPSKAQQVLSMINMEPFSLKTCLLRPSIKEHKMSSWIRFVYDCGTELIRLQIREHKAKNGTASTRELVGVSKSSKKHFQLAECKESKWTLTNSNLSISDGTGGCVLELKDDNQMIKLYMGRKLEYQPKCCGAHSEDLSAVTAVKFCAEQPYGKALALLDTQSQLIMVNEDWFLLPWIAISFLFVNGGGEEGAKLIAGAVVQKNAVSGTETNAVPEAVAVVAAGVGTAAAGTCGTCGTACGGDTVMASSKANHASCGTCKAAVASGGNGGHAEFTGCGAGCNGSCGSMADGSTKVDHAKPGGCGGGCGGGNCGVVVTENSKGGNAKSAGCGSGCGGSGGCGAMVAEGAKGGIAKSGGCGSGCGGGGGGGVVIKASGTVVGEAKSGGCGSGCGGGCSAMMVEGSNAGHAKSGGCGSGYGGGCGGMMNAGTNGVSQSQTKSGGCGSGYGGGCGGGAMVVEGSKDGHAVSGGCGSGCGGGCGVMLNASTKAGSEGQAMSGGCGSGCGGGCGGGGAVFSA